MSYMEMYLIFSIHICIHENQDTPYKNIRVQQRSNYNRITRSHVVFVNTRFKTFVENS